MPSARRLSTAALLAAAFTAGSASAASVTVTLENLSPEGGLFTTPVWVGFHDGTFDLFDLGDTASTGLERIAEDGSFGAIAEEFADATGGNGLGGVITAPEGFAGAPVLEPGEITSQTFEVDEFTQRFLSLGAMVLPSNDAFFGTDDAIELFDADGTFFGGAEFTVTRDDILDAGTELNTELDAAFLNQTGPDTGITENGVITVHPGFIGSVGGPAAGPNGEAASILGGTVVTGDVISPTLGDFTADGFGGLVRVTIALNDGSDTGDGDDNDGGSGAGGGATAVPTPSALGAGFIGLLALARRRNRG